MRDRHACARRAGRRSASSRATCAAASWRRAAAPPAAGRHPQRHHPVRRARPLGAALHEVNVIGTLQLLTACADVPACAPLVVRGSASIYGAGPSALLLHRGPRPRRDAAHALPARRRRARGPRRRFARRHPAVICSVLRLQPAIAPDMDSPITRVVRGPVVPTVLGFDPRVQCCSTRTRRRASPPCARDPGPRRRRGDGRSRPRRAARRRLARAGAPSAAGATPRSALAACSSRRPRGIVRYLRFGRGVDTTRMRDELRFVPQHSRPRRSTWSRSRSATRRRRRDRPLGLARDRVKAPGRPLRAACAASTEDDPTRGVTPLRRGRRAAAVVPL